MEKLIIFKYEDLETKEQAFVASYSEENARIEIQKHTHRPISLTRTANGHEFPGLFELKDWDNMATNPHFAKVLINHIKPF